MKKNIIIAAIAAASALLLSVSCQKESQPESQNGINGGAKTFTATIEQGLTKTTITSEYKVNWTTTDKISINGKSYTASPKTDDATKADFTAEDDEASADNGKYKAIYPASLYVPATESPEAVSAHFALPTTQTYTAGEFNAPMYAESETTTLSFKNICAVLAITVTSADIPTLKYIKVKSDKKLNGTFTVNSTTDGGYKAVIGTDGTNEVVLSMGETAINLTTDGTTFYIAIPAQEYSYLKIYLSEDGTLYKRAMITKKAAGLGTIDCNKIYNIAYETNAVQIYANGPYWATMNLGAATETEYGDYYVWGATKKAYSAVDYTKTSGAFTFVTSNPYGDIYKNTWNASDGFCWNNTPFTDGVYSNSNKKVFTKYIPSNKTDYWKGTDSPDNKITLDLADDAATVNWGSAWKMPTGGDSGQFQTLVSNTTNVWTTESSVNGRKLTGKVATTDTPDYSDITLFFPAACYGQNTSHLDAPNGGYYWSSTILSSDPCRAYYLYIYKNTNFDPNHQGFRFFGFSVRPVSD